jgi:TetR/AcrR family transcriptional regulator, cholesterol catabolism regulator
MTRDDILDAAAQVFSQKGYHAASMQDIARAVNLRKGSLYHHVSSKQEILVDLLDRALDLLIERVSLVLDQPIAPEEKLRQAMRVYLEIFAEHADLSAVLLLEHRSLEPELHSRHIPRRDRFEGMWRELIREGKQSGIFCCASPSLAARALLGVMNWTITWYRPDGKLTPAEIADQFADLFLTGLLARESIELSKPRSDGSVHG